MNKHTNTNQKRKRKPIRIRRFINWKWIATITVLSFAVSVSMSYLSNESLRNVNNIAAFLILLVFILVGVLFDMIGVAATSVTEKELNSMASRRVHGAREAVWLSKNAEKVASFCNDVIGDISGIISGATGAIIIARISANLAPMSALILSLCITGLIAAMTIGGKAMCKAIGMSCCVQIIHFVGRVISILPLHLEKR